MNHNEMHFEGSFSVTGTPFDPFSHEDRTLDLNARIMPSTFIHPDSPVRFTLLRNTIPADSEPTKYDFF